MKQKYLLKYFSVLIVLLINTNSFGQDTIIAKVGNLNITKDEFTDRYEFVPQPNSNKDQSLKKYDLLYSIIAEKLWALEAEDENLISALETQTAFASIEKMYVRDALYKIEIGDKSKASEQEINDALKKYFSDLFIAVIYEKDSSQIFDDFEKLNSGISLDSLSEMKKIEPKVIEIKYGEMNEELENLFYNLNENEYSTPLNLNGKWVIFKNEKTIKRSFTSEDINAAVKRVKKIIEERKSDKVYNNFAKQFFSNLKVKTDGEIFWQIADFLTQVLSERKTANAIPDSENVKMEVKDILNLESKLGKETLDKPFVQFEENPVSTRNFLKQFIFDGFYSNQVDEKTISVKLDSRVKSFIENELLTREGYNRGLQNLPEVQSRIQMWKQNYLAKILQQKIVDSLNVTDDEVYQYYLKKNSGENESPVQVNILEILTDSLEVVEQVLNELNNGADFRKLAAIHTERKWTKNNGGEFGFFPSTMYGEVGKTAASMNEGEIYGPIKLDEGYSIIKLIGKKKAENISDVPFDSIKSDLKKEALYKKLSQYFMNFTAELANKFGVKINKPTFNKINLLDLKTYVFRYMGFGGRITAAPLTPNFTEWVPVWEKSTNVNP